MNSSVIVIINSLLFLETILAFAWEPIGNKYAVIHGDAPHTNVTIYGVKNNGLVESLSKFDLIDNANNIL